MFIDAVTAVEYMLYVNDCFHFCVLVNECGSREEAVSIILRLAWRRTSTVKADVMFYFCFWFMGLIM